MASLPALLFWAFAGCCHGYALEPTLVWPEEYHFNAEEINLVTGIMKPFEIWYSAKNNRSRIDLYGGTVSRYYVGMYYDKDGDEHDGKIYMIHPEVDEDDQETEVKCELVPSWGDQEDFLPYLEDFVFKGTQQHDGKEVQVWIKESEKRDVIRSVETILVEEVGGVGIPLHHSTKSFDTKDGSLTGDIVVNYYNYYSKISVKELEYANTKTCSSWDVQAQDLDEAVKHLHPTIASDVDLAFHRFKSHHNRNYEDEEHHLRKFVFRNNWHKIVDHNKKKLSYTLGLNQFADKTMGELAYLSGVKSSGSDPIRGTHPYPHSDEELEAMAADFPEDFDLRTEGVITPVRNQAHCGSCWAFAAAATLEGHLARSNGGKRLDLSEQSLVDCAWAFRSHGCSGTEAIDAVYDYIEKHGMPTVDEYGPYLEEDGVCKIKNMTRVFGIRGYVGVTKNSPNALKAALYKYGPVTIGVLVTPEMISYKSGVFYDISCEPGAMNHAVTMVGYGYRNGDLYWIVKNSWGEMWGEAGYILMSATNNNCNVMVCPYFPLV